MFNAARTRIHEAAKPLAMGIDHDYVENPDDAASKLFIGNDEVNWNALSGNQQSDLKDTVEDGRDKLTEAVAATGADRVKELATCSIKETTKRVEADRARKAEMIETAQKMTERKDDFPRNIITLGRLA